MAAKFTRMAYENADDMLFGHAKKPISYGLGIKAGTGRVIPEIGCTPRPGTEGSAERLAREYVDYITEDAVTRAVSLGFPDLQLDTAWVAEMASDASTAASVASGQKALVEKLHREYGINLAVRHTVPDLRRPENGLRKSTDALLGCCETACENGADVLSVESAGGREFAGYAAGNGDITAFLFGTGYLGSIDAEYIWTEISEICRKNRCLAGGDAGGTGTDMLSNGSGGMMDGETRSVFSAVARCIAAAKTIVALECGASGPGMGRAYEGIICKAVTGMPSSQEGKNSQCAHSDMQGNLMAQCADLWSNETVGYHPEFGGSSVQCWLGPLGYECSLMNTAITTGQGRVLRDLYMISDRARSPEGFVLSYDNAWKVGKAIVQHGGSYYLRAKSAGIEGAKIIREGFERKELILTRKQLETLDRFLAELEALPDDEDRFFELCSKRYKGLVPGYDPRSYGL